MTNKTSHRLQTKRFAMIAIAALVVLMAVACGGGGKPANQELRIRIAGDVSSFDPQLAISSTEISVAKQLYRGLFTYNDNLDVVPAIATELPAKDNGGISDDGLTYTIKLRHDATWSDGQPLVAADFVYAFQRLFDPDAGAQGAYSAFYTAIKGAAAASTGEGSTSDIGVTAPGEHTLVFTLEQPQPTLVTLLALWPASPLRQDIIEQHGDSWTEPGTMVTDGPFVLAKYEPSIEIDLQKNLNYWASDGAKLEQIEYHIIPDDDAALLAYRNNEIDMTSIPLQAARDYEGHKEQVRFGQLETMAVQYNVSKAPFDNKVVRQAFSRAIDRGAYVETLLSGIGVAAEGWLPPGMPGVSANVTADLGFDENAAKTLLADAGYANGENFPKVTITIPNDDTYQSVAAYVQEELKKNLGIDVEIDSLEANAYGEAWGNGDFEVALFDWFADYADPEDWLPQQFATDGSLNVTHYSNLQVDDLLTQASTELDQTKRLGLYEQAHNLIIADQAVTPLYHPERNYLVKHRVEGLDVTPLDAEPSDWFYEQVKITGGGSAPPASNPDE